MGLIVNNFYKLMLFAVYFCTTLPLASNVHAHALAPSLLQIEELEDASQGLFLFWKTPAKHNGFPLSPRLPNQCKLASKPTFSTDNQSITLSGNVYCSEVTLVGQTVGIHNIQKNPAPVIIRFKQADGTIVSGLINAENPTWLIPDKLTAEKPAYKYLKLGFKHLLSGYDHVLFVIAMVLLIKGATTLIKAITCFTLGHSISLALSTFNIVSFSTGIVEILIAASIIAMALEIYNKTTWFAKNVWLVATLFGLLHGLGFAAVLSDFNLPTEAQVVALLAFNVGIELGQLIVVAACLLLGKLIVLMKVEKRSLIENSPRYIAYLFGSISAFWVLERTQLLIFG